MVPYLSRHLGASENTEVLYGEKAYSLLPLAHLLAQMPKYHSWFPREKRPLTLP